MVSRLVLTASFNRGRNSSFIAAIRPIVLFFMAILLYQRLHSGATGNADRSWSSFPWFFVLTKTVFLPYIQSFTSGITAGFCAIMLYHANYLIVLKSLCLTAFQINLTSFSKSFAVRG